MEEEMNYLSEKIEALEIQINLYTSVVDKHKKGRLRKSYERMIEDFTEEKQLLENIESYITINELK